MTVENLRLRVAGAIGRLGVKEVASRLGLAPETVLRISVPGAGVHPGSVALAKENAHKLGETTGRVK